MPVPLDVGDPDPRAARFRSAVPEGPPPVAFVPGASIWYDREGTGWTPVAVTRARDGQPPIYLLRRGYGL